MAGVVLWLVVHPHMIGDVSGRQELATDVTWDLLLVANHMRTQTILCGEAGLTGLEKKGDIVERLQRIIHRFFKNPQGIRILLLLFTTNIFDCTKCRIKWHHFVLTTNMNHWPRWSLKMIYGENDVTYVCHIWSVQYVMKYVCHARVNIRLQAAAMCMELFQLDTSSHSLIQQGMYFIQISFHGNSLGVHLLMSTNMRARRLTTQIKRRSNVCDLNLDSSGTRCM